MAELKTSLLSTPNFKGVDILLTSPWPRDVGTFANSAVSVLFSGGMVFQLNLTKDCLSGCCGSLGYWAMSECLRKLRVKKDSRCSGSSEKKDQWEGEFVKFQGDLSVSA